jgi:hypothetical protein
LICVLYGCQVVFSLQEKLPHAKRLSKINHSLQNLTSGKV